jgi:hypothetical protein
MPAEDLLQLASLLRAELLQLEEQRRLAQRQLLPSLLAQHGDALDELIARLDDESHGPGPKGSPPSAQPTSPPSLAGGKKCP